MPLKRTPLYSAHLALGAKMVPFAGYEMPVFYPSGIIKEHITTREAAGLFDISHMDTIVVKGADALPFLQALTTNDATRLQPFVGQYTVMCNEKGGAIDDLFLFRLQDTFLIVANASNADKVVSRLREALKQKPQAVEIVDRHETHGLMSLQGPKAKEITAKLLKKAGSKAPQINLPELKRNRLFAFSLPLGCSGTTEILVSRTGYTGGDGFEFYLENAGVEFFWDLILREGNEFGILPVGLGARDSLRLEAGLPLYGHEYDEDTSPIEAGYPWAVKFDKGDFVGKKALQAPQKKKLIGLTLEGSLIARQGFEIFAAANPADGSVGARVGQITSGTFSPMLKKSIALAYVEVSAKENLDVKIRDAMVPAKVTRLPFWKA